MIRQKFKTKCIKKYALFMPGKEYEGVCDMDAGKVLYTIISPAGLTYEFHSYDELAKIFSYPDWKEVIEDSTAGTDNERVNHPSHYTWLKKLCNIEVIDITRHMDFDLGNAVKYLLRAGHKNEKGLSDKEKMIEDLKKAVWYINDKIKILENE